MESFFRSNYAVASGTLLIGLLVAQLGIKFVHRDKRPPWVVELDTLAIPSKRKFQGTAVVSGGSIAGMITARICADHFENVVLVDPEFTKVFEGGAKTRTLQYHAVHAYLSFLLDGLRVLWPNFDEEITAAGGLTGPADYKTYYSGLLIDAPHKQYAPRPIPQTVYVRRPVFEGILQRLLLHHPSSRNIRIVDGTVRRLVRSLDGKGIDKVIVRDLGGKETTFDEVALIADCTGATQAGIKWLPAAGYPLPADIRASYNARMQYMTITYSISHELAAILPIPSGYDSSCVLYSYQPDFRRDKVGFVLSRMDNDTAQLIFGGWGITSSDLPETPEEILSCVKDRKAHVAITSWFFQVISMLTEQGKPTFEPTKIPALSKVSYNTVSSLPSNFVAIGDSSMQLNPIHGQGCAKALLGGLALNFMLTSCDHEVPLPSNFSSRYFRRAEPRSQSLWDGTKPIDYGFPTTEPVQGETLSSGKFMRWFSGKMVSAATKDDEVASALWHVRHLLAPDSILLSPRILWKILTSSSCFED